MIASDSGPEEPEDRQDPAVVAFRGWQAELAEDAGHVLLDRPAGDDEAAAMPALERPSAIRDSTSRSRGVNAASPWAWRPARRSWPTTSGSRAVPPAATRVRASMNSATSATRSLSR